MIRLENTTKIFNQGTVDENIAINDISLTVKEHDFITIIGSNGAGKTTLFNLIAGSIFPTDGRIILKDEDLTQEPEYKRARFIGRIFQDPMLGTASNMALEDNMMICLKKGFKGLKISLNRKMRDFFREQLKALEMNLENRLKDNVALLSGGQRQALTLLMMDCGEIILDVSGEEKQNLTVEKLIDRFHKIRQKEFGTDEVLLTNNECN